MRSPFSVFYLIFFLLVLAFLAVIIQFGIITFTFQKLGLSAQTAILLLCLSLFGSMINLPLFRIASLPGPDYTDSMLHGLLRGGVVPYTGKTVIAINIGGGVVPILFSCFLLFRTGIGIFHAATGIAIVTTVSYLSSRPVPGMGIGMPIFIAPLTAASVAILLSTEHNAPLAYIAGTLGVLIGADLLRLKDIQKIGTPVASIGGAGTFDGIFITGIVAVLLA